VNDSLSRRAKAQRQFSPFRLAVRADVVRLYGRYSLGLLVWAMLFVRTFRPVFTMRLCQAASGLPTPLSGMLSFPFRVLHSLAQQWAGVTLGWDTQIGPGFLITHGWGFVTGRGTKTGRGIAIGSNVTVYHGVTIGQKHKISASGRVESFPTIEDKVWVGAHAVIAGGVVVGCGSRIAPGTIVIGDVEPYSIVGGNPMRVIRTSALPDVLNPADLSLLGTGPR
jgi:serine O-acetyltransferase